MQRDKAPRLVFISTSNSEQTISFLRDYPPDTGQDDSKQPTPQPSDLPITLKQTSFPGELYLDPESKSHADLGLKSGYWRSLVTPIVKTLPKFGVKALWEAARLGFANARLAGNSWVMGGTFVFAADGQILFQHREEHPGDWADVCAVVSALGEPYSTALKDTAWLTHPEALEQFKIRRERRDKASPPKRSESDETANAGPDAPMCESGACALPADYFEKKKKPQTAASKS